MILFFTDPHIGVSRTTNTTMASAKALRDRIYNTSLAVCQAGKKRKYQIAMLGDLYDKHSNPEPVIGMGAHILQYCDYALAGNHDVKNVAGSMSSLGLVDIMMANDENPSSPIIMNPDLSQPYYFASKPSDHEDVWLTFVPHCLTQELFEQSVRMACEEAHAGHYNVLCLHCNVGDAYGQVEAEGSTLSLTDELQELVIQHFDLTMVGHEHTPQKLHKGKIVVMGNLLPLSFGELSHRYHYLLNPETKELSMICHFDADKEVKSYSVRDLESLEAFDAAYVTIGGEIKPEGYPLMARQIQKIWSNSPNTLMVSNVVDIDRPDALSRQRVDASKQTLLDLVRSEAKGKGFAEELSELEKVQ